MQNTMPRPVTSVCQSDALDFALQLLFSKIPVDARRFLRRPLARWHVAVTKFLQSPQQRADDLRFTAAIFSIAASCHPRCTSWVLAMFCALHRIVEMALAQTPIDCPHRYSSALLFTVESIFPDGRGRVDVCPGAIVVPRPKPRTPKGRCSVPRHALSRHLFDPREAKATVT